MRASDYRALLNTYEKACEAKYAHIEECDECEETREGDFLCFEGDELDITVNEARAEMPSVKTLVEEIERLEKHYTQ